MRVYTHLCTHHIYLQEAYAYSIARRSPFMDPGNVMLELPDKMLLELANNIFANEVQSIQAFSELGSEFIMKLIMFSRHSTCKCGDVLYGFGDISEEISFILDGTIRISTHIKGQEIIAGYIRAGGCCGDLEYLSKCTRLATYTATAKCRLLTVSYSILNEALLEYYDAGLGFKHMIEARLKSFRHVLSLHTISPKDIVLPKHLTTLRRLSGFIGNPLTQSKHNLLEILDQSALYRGTPRRDSFRRLPTISEKGSGQKKTAPSVGSIGRRHSSSNFDADPSSKNALIRLVNLSGLLHAHEKIEPVVLRTQLWLDGRLVDPAHMSETDFASIGQSRKSYDSLCHILVELEKSNIAHQLLLMHRGVAGVYASKEEDANTLSKYYLIHPDGRLKSVWDVFVGVLILLSAIYVPIIVCFSVPSSVTVNGVGYAIDILFFMDIIASFRTVYFSQEHDAYIAVPALIFQHYINTWFFVDIISCLPFEACLGSVSSGQVNVVQMFKTLRLFRLLKILRILKLPQYAEKAEQITGITPSVFELVSTVFKVLLISHFTACAWWGLCSVISPYAWFDNPADVPPDASLARQYLISLYMVVTTLTTTGYGDLVSINSAERVVNIFMMILGATIFGYVIANVTNIMNNLNLSQTHKNEKLSEVSQFLSDRHCGGELAAGIVRHFRYRYITCMYIYACVYYVYYLYITVIFMYNSIYIYIFMCILLCLCCYVYAAMCILCYTCYMYICTSIYTVVFTLVYVYTCVRLC